MISTDIGIDLGTSNILIFVKKKGIVLNEPSVVAIEKDTKKVLAVGNEANEMLGRTPEKVVAIRPMKDGVIADLEATEIMLNEFIKKLKNIALFIRPRILICCPTNITPIEKTTLKEVAERTGARNIYIEEEPKVAALGAGMNIKLPIANMVVDIGGGTTDIAILSLGGIVVSNSIKIAGNVFNNDIIKYIKGKYKLLIGEITAENIKTNFTNIYNPSSDKKIEIKGRDLVSGLPKKIEINQEETKEALEESITKIVNAIINVLEISPPELSSDIVEKGIVLTGGASQLCGLLEYLEDKLKVPVLIAESPLTCVVEGTGVLLDELKIYEKDQ